MRFRHVPLLLIGVSAPVAASGQTPLQLSSFSLELRGEVAVPVSDFRESLDLGTGFGLGATVKYAVGRPLALYAGWDRFEFDGRPEQLGVEVVDQGFRLGAQLGFNQPTGSLNPFATAGVTFNRARLEVRDSSGETTTSGDHSPGFELGAGVMIPVFRGVWLVPEGRYRSHSSSWETNLLQDSDASVDYLGFNLGVVIRMPGTGSEGRDAGDER